MTSLRKPEEEIWYVHAPLKNEKRPAVNSVQASNIPYLNGVMDTDEELNKKPTIWFKDTDSDFIKLSKLGGREDLLIHRYKPSSKEPVAYPRPAWWTDMLTEVEDPSKNEEKKPYVFEVPAWFAHQDKRNESELKDSYISPNYPYVHPNMPNQNNKQHESIEEPRKYGQLRNYLNPAQVKKSVPQNDFVTYKGKKIESATTMPKLISNFYQQEKPKDFQEWKNKQDQKVIRKSQTLR